MTSPRETVRTIWQDVLEVPAVADTDDFFDLGGQSLRAMDVTSRIKAALGVKVSVRVLFTQRTFGAFADAVEQVLAESRV